MLSPNGPMQMVHCANDAGMVNDYGGNGREGIFQDVPLWKSCLRGYPREHPEKNDQSLVEGVAPPLVLCRHMNLCLVRKGQAVPASSAPGSGDCRACRFEDCAERLPKKCLPETTFERCVASLDDTGPRHAVQA